MNKEDLVFLLEGLRVDAIIGDNDLCADEIGHMLAILGVEEYKEIYLD